MAAILGGALSLSGFLLQTFFSNPIAGPFVLGISSGADVYKRQLEYKKTMKLKYATGFDVYYYKEGYKLLDVHEDRQYLIVPEGKKKPADLDKEIVVLKQPLEHILSLIHIFLAASLY